MIYLSGKKVECSDRIGVMLSFNAGKQSLTGHSLFAADNGCFVQADKYSDDGFITWLHKLDRNACLFATAPDVVGDAEATPGQDSTNSTPPESKNSLSTT